MSIMELIFFYINQAASNFIEKQGFNFSSNYRFFVEYIEGKYVLKQEENNVQLPKDFFDEHGCITTVQALMEEAARYLEVLNNWENMEFSYPE